MKRKLVWVRWVDACHWANEWRAIDDAQLDGYMVESAGILIRDDEAGLIMATDIDPDDERFRHTSFIPRAMIRKKKVFTVDV